MCINEVYPKIELKTNIISIILIHMKNNKKNKQIQRCLVFDDLNSTYQIKFKRLKKSLKTINYYTNHEYNPKKSEKIKRL